MNLFSVVGKTALITGSSQGIGFALARGLVSAGAKVVLNGRDERKLAEAASSFEADSVFVMPFDVTDHEAVQAAVEKAEDDGIAIDILINNAGMQCRAPLENFDPADFEKLLQTNVAGVFHVSQAVSRNA